MGYAKSTLKPWAKWPERPVVTATKSQSKSKNKSQSKTKRRNELLAKNVKILCTYCKTHLNQQNFSWDHKIPKKIGGARTLENLTPACLECNVLKDDMPYEDFINNPIAQEIIQLRLKLNENPELLAEYKSLKKQFKRKKEIEQFVKDEILFEQFETAKKKLQEKFPNTNFNTIMKLDDNSWLIEADSRIVVHVEVN
jgi:hypothetical protein